MHVKSLAELRPKNPLIWDLSKPACPTSETLQEYKKWVLSEVIVIFLICLLFSIWCHWKSRARIPSLFFFQWFSWRKFHFLNLLPLSRIGPGDVSTDSSLSGCRDDECLSFFEMLMNIFIFDVDFYFTGILIFFFPCQLSLLPSTVIHCHVI